MNTVDWLKALTLGLCLSLLVIPVSSTYAQPEEEEEEPVQTRPNPMDSRMKMRGAERSRIQSKGVMDDGEHGNVKGQMRAPASRSAPAQNRQMGPQGMQRSQPRSFDGVDGEAMGTPIGIQQMQGIGSMPNVQDGGGMVMPQQMQQ